MHVCSRVGSLSSFVVEGMSYRYPLTPCDDPPIEFESREAIARLAAWQRRRLAWHHLLPLLLALLTMLVCAVGIAESQWPGFRSLVGDKPNTVTARWQVWAAIYLCAALLASLAAARFRLGAALLRFPVVLSLALIGGAGLLLVWIAGHHLLAGGESSSGGGPDADNADQTTRQHVPPRDLAAALLSPADVQRVLGTPVGPPDTGGNWIIRSASMCRYRALDGSATMTLVTRRRPSERSTAQLQRRGRQLGGLGDAAVEVGHGIYALSGEYLIMLTAWRRDREKVDHAAITALMRRLIGCLPADYELDAADRDLFASGVRGRLNLILALLGFRLTSPAPLQVAGLGP
jgi:hypothetical protein